jgi:hypothetical protein
MCAGAATCTRTCTRTCARTRTRIMFIAHIFNAPYTMLRTTFVYANDPTYNAPTQHKTSLMP